MPRLEMHGLGGTDTEQDSQYFVTAYALRQRWVEAGAALLNKAKVEACGVGDGLQMIRRSEITVIAGNRRKLARAQSGNCLREGVAKIGIHVIAAVARPPARVHGQLH